MRPGSANVCFEWKADIASGRIFSHSKREGAFAISEQDYISRAVRFGIAGALIIAPVALYLAAQAPSRRPQPRLVPVEGCYYYGQDKVLTLAQRGTLIDAKGEPYPYQDMPVFDEDIGPAISVSDMKASMEGNKVVLHRNPGRGYYWRATGTTLRLFADEHEVVLTKRPC